MDTISTTNLLSWLLLLLGGTGLACIYVLLRRRSPAPPPVVNSVALQEEAAPQALDTQRWLALAAECVLLFDEVERHGEGFGPQGREIAHHICARLQQILTSAGVELIAGEACFDGLRHQLEYPAKGRPGARIQETLSPGFVVEQRVLRRARVRIAGP